MFPLVVIDLNDQASPQTTAWVTAACSQAIAAGACVAEGTELSEPPLAVAIVRLQAKRNRIHLEVGRREEKQTTWRTRDLQFRARDPEAERWRAVGLTIATLVGEIVSPSEVAELENASPPSPEPVPAPALAPAPPNAHPPESTPPESRPPESTPPESRPPEPELPEPSPELPGVPQPSRGLFVGLAFTAGPALHDYGLRWGGATRAGWVFDAGWLLAFSGSYSLHDARAAAATVSWLHLGASFGHLFELGPSWGASLSAGAGVRGVNFRAADGERTEHVQHWNPFLQGSAELWRHLGRGVSAWAALDVTGLNVETRMLVNGTERFILPRIDTVGLLGLRWMP